MNASARFYMSKHPGPSSMRHHELPVAFKVLLGVSYAVARKKDLDPGDAERGEVVKAGRRPAPAARVRRQARVRFAVFGVSLGLLNCVCRCGDVRLQSR